MPLIAELVALPVATLVALIAVFPARNEAEERVTSGANWLLALGGLAMLSWVSYRVVRDWDLLLSVSSARRLALPIWLSLGLLPFLVVAAWLMSLGSTFTRINVAIGVGTDRRRVKFAVLTLVPFRQSRLSGFGGGWARAAADAGTLSGARQEIREFLSRRKREQQEAIEVVERLRRFAGIDGTDSQGRRLDQREFAETRSSLRWLATVQMGWYRRDGTNRYRPDLLQMAESRFLTLGLPEEHGVVMRVDHTGQRWFGYRRTLSGWCLGIGAGGPPPDQMVWDGASPPDGFPGEQSGWEISSPNWEYG
jgi:hypothetical protein